MRRRWQRLQAWWGELRCVWYGHDWGDCSNRQGVALSRHCRRCNLDQIRPYDLALPAEGEVVFARVASWR